MAIFTAAAVAAALAIESTFVAAAVAFTLNAALYAAASIGLSYAVKALSGKPEQSKDNFGVQGKLTGGGAVPRSFGLGYHVTAGSLVYANTHGQGYDTPNAFLTQVIALSDLPGEKLVGFWVNGVKVTMTSADAAGSPATDLGYQVPEYVRPHNGEGAPTPHLWVKYYDGTQTTADSFMVGSVSTVGRPYTSDHVGHGICYAIIHAFNDENLWNGFPQFKFELSGVPLYDPSKDSSVGGSGPQRYDTPSTWGGDGDNLPAVQIYNILRGFAYGGAWLYGLQNTSAARLPVANWIAQIAKCRTTITGAGGPEATYRSGGQINVDAQPANAIEALLTACQGKLSEIGGFYKIHLGAPDSPTFVFSDVDILSTENQTYRPFLSLSDSVNGIQATYPDPDQGWNYATAPALYRADLELRDGSRRLMANPQFDFVPYAEQAQRLQKSAIEEAQRARTHTLTLPPAFWVIEPGDVGEWTSVRNGYSSKQFRVDAAVDKANLDVSLSLTEVDPSDYSWNRATDLQPVTGGTTVSSPPPAQGVTSWNAQPYTLVDDAGVGRRPAILISWDGGQPGISGLQFEVRLASDSSSVTRGRSDRPTAGNLIITQSLLPATAYQVRGQYIPSSPRDMAWSSWTAVTTPDVRYSLAEFDAAVKAQVTTIQDALQDQLNFALQQIAAISANQDARNWIDKKEIRSQLAARSDAAFAAISDVQTVAVNTQTAFASYQGTVTAQFATVNASITTNASAIATLNGYAAAAWGVTLDVNGSIAGIQLVNSGSGTSSFVVTADKFQIKLPGYNGGAPVSVFTTGTIGGVASIGISGNVFLDGTLNASKIVAGSITTTQIAVGGVDLPNIIAGAVSNTQIFSTSSVGTTPAATTVASQSVNIQSGKATLRFCAQWQVGAVSYGGNRPVNAVNLIVDGSVVRQFTWTMTLQPGSSVNYELNQAINVEWTVSGLSAGNHTFAVQVASQSGIADGNLNCSAGQMYVTDFRR